MEIGECETWCLSLRCITDSLLVLNAFVARLICQKEMNGVLNRFWLTDMFYLLIYIYIYIYGERYE